jgi:hypothetical protein
MYAKHPKLAREFEEKTPKDKKLPMKKAWTFLKESRQTELGEFHPDFPSSYGPMTAISSQPTQRALDSWRKRGGSFDENKAQPYEAFLHEGMRGKPVSNDSLEWEDTGLNSKLFENINVKPFNLEGKIGHWFAPASNYYDWKERMKEIYPEGSDQLNEHYGFNSSEGRAVGIRMPLDASMGQFRDRGYNLEGAEAFIEGDIPPERLVMLSNIDTHRRGKPWPDGLGRRDN